MKMKTITLFSLAASMVFFAACKNNDNDAAFVSEQDAAEMIAASLSENSSGLTAVVEVSADGSNTAVDNSGGRVAVCGYTYNESFNRTSPVGSSTYNYDFSYGYVLTCSADAPLTLAVNVTFDGEFDGLRLSSNHSGAGNFEFAALDKDVTAFIVNGTYSQAGTFQSKIGNKNAGSSSTTITLSDVMVDKTNQQITSGAAAVSITGNVTGKTAFSFAATVTLTGNKTGTIEINNNTYAVNLLTGEVTKQ
ncbi:MAG: hypothetical protein ABI663_24490 [Chryseolinea sp.]